MSADRVRMVGKLSLGRRGLMLSTKDEAIWIVDSAEPADHFIGAQIVLEGVIVGLDRVRADWIGNSSDRGYNSEA